MTLRLPHPLLLLLAAVAVAAATTWVLPAGEYDRRDDPATGRRVVVPATYHRVEPAPVGPFAAAVAVPRGLVEAGEVVAAVLFVGGAWVVVDRVGTLSRLVAALVARLRRRGLYAIPAVSLFFGTMGALENMQEEIIPLVPVLLLLGRGLGFDAVTVVAMSAGAAIVGSAFGPTNPFQAGIAMKLAELPVASAFWIRVAMLVAGFALWVTWTMRHATRSRVTPDLDRGDPSSTVAPPSLARDLFIFAVAVTPMAAYVYGALVWGWGINELSAGFLVAGVAAGLLGGLTLGATIEAYLAGMQTLVGAAMMIGVARAISIVLTDGRVIDTILRSLAAPLEQAPALLAALLQVPFHALIHVVVPSVSGQAVLTMPLLVPLSDLLAIPRQVAVLAYQTGAGLMEGLTPTNGSLMAILLAAGVPFGRWVRFAIGGVLLLVGVGVMGMMAAARLG
jgi:uncharacterized ion transporter superfamily protein YfcC